MKRLTLFLTIILIYNFSYSQADSLQRQINEQVWKPFIKSFNSGDTEGFMSVHSKDMTRVEQDSKNIYGFDKYYEYNKRGKERNNPPKWKSNIELRFIQRIAAGDRAFEVGYYKTSSVTIATGQSRSNYGKFHVLLRKENGTWKILMDADASEKTDESIFLTGKPL
jgi:ketosteroid isomerase-like protein